MIAAELIFELFVAVLALFFLLVFLSLGLHGRAGRLFPAPAPERDGFVPDGVSWKPCLVCGRGVMVPRREDRLVEHEGRTGFVPVLFAVCRSCGASVAGAGEAAANKKAMEGFRAL